MRLPREQRAPRAGRQDGRSICAVCVFLLSPPPPPTPLPLNSTWWWWACAPIWAACPSLAPASTTAGSAPATGGASAAAGGVVWFGLVWVGGCCWAVWGSAAEPRIRCPAAVVDNSWSMLTNPLSNPPTHPPPTATTTSAAASGRAPPPPTWRCRSTASWAAARPSSVESRARGGDDDAISHACDLEPRAKAWS